MLFQNNSFLPERPGVLATPAVFIAVTGNCLTQSWINNRLAVMGKCLNPKMAGKLKGSRIRKGIISMQSDMGETSGISKECLTGSSDGRRRFTQYEAEIINKATKNLPSNVQIKDIIQALSNGKDCQEYKLFDSYTRQQLRDKFRNLAKKRA